MSGDATRSRALGRGLVGASLIAGLALAPLVVPTSSREDGNASALGARVAHADPVPAPSVRPTPTAPPTEAPTPTPKPTENQTCPQESPTYIKAQPAILDHVGVRRAWEVSRGSGVTVAVVDSGVAAGNQHFNASGKTVVLPGVDFSGENTDGRVDVGEHGTAIAGAIAMQTHCLVLDEPTAMLDPLGRQEVLQTVQRLHRERGITVIYITHFMEEAAAADRVIVMEAGRIAAEGTPREVFQDVSGMKARGLDVPLAVELAALLRADGISLPQDLLTDKELVRALCPSC